MSSWKNYTQTSTHKVGNPIPIHYRSFSPFIAILVSLNDDISVQNIKKRHRNRINSDTKELLRIKKDAAACLIQD